MPFAPRQLGNLGEKTGKQEKYSPFIFLQAILTIKTMNFSSSSSCATLKTPRKAPAGQAGQKEESS